MAGGLQELRRRIRSVQNTQQITRAMKLVAGAKLRRAEERARASRDYFEQIRAITARAVHRAYGAGHPLLEARPLETAAMVVVTSDRGLAGPFNSNVLRRAMLELGQVDAKRKVVFAVGRKGRDFFRYRNVPMIEEFIGLGDDPTYRQARAIADTVMARYLEREVDSVYLTFTKYHNAMSQEPVTVRLLPVEMEDTRKPEEWGQIGYVFEPDATEVFQDLLPRYVEMLIFGALLESKASEQGARMTAMDNASKNAEELIRRLILLRNRLRQAAITREIAELVGGAEALK